MKASIDHLLYLIKEVGVVKALDCIDIETIHDPDDERDTIKIICRTVKFSCEQLERVIIDRIAERDAKLTGPSPQRV